MPIEVGVMINDQVLSHRDWFLSDTVVVDLLCCVMSIATHSGDHCQTEAPCPVKDCATEFNGKQCNVRFATVRKMLMNTVGLNWIT